MTFADRIIAFNQSLHLYTHLPPSIEVMNPFQDNPEVLEISSAFYRKFYQDHRTRKIILGINPGRLGAGSTGIPFTDSKRLLSHCHINCSMHLHEPSSVFVYEVIDAYGGVQAFYRDFYISSVCPLGFLKIDAQGNATNYNYYDSASLTKAITPFVVASLEKQISFGIDTKIAFCLGTGKNYKFLQAINNQHRFFDTIIPLEHPRYVMQYKSRSKEAYITKYLQELSGESTNNQA